MMFTDADPGSSATIAEKFPEALHVLCLWHILQNLQKHLLSKMGSDYTKFSNDFSICQQHMTETVFWKEYNVLPNTWPEAVDYSDAHLTPNVKDWSTTATGSSKKILDRRCKM